MVAPASQMPSIADFINANPNAPPNEMLSVVLAETQRLKEENAWIQQEYRQATEVQLDENLNFKPKTMAQLQRLARMYAESGLVPDHYKNNVAGCAIGIQMALRMHVDILTFLQCSFVHKGKIGIEAKLAMARLNTSGKIKGRVTYKLERGPDGKVKSCTATAEDADSGEIFSQTVDWDMVVAEGWNNSNGTQKSKWNTLPDLMFQYRAGIFLARIHYPDVLLGMYTIDELEDMARTGESAAPPTGAPNSALAELSERFGAPLQPAKPRATRVPEPVKTPEPPAEEGRTEPAVEGAKPAAKSTPKPPAVKETATKTADESKPHATAQRSAAPTKPVEPPKTSGKGPSVEGLKSYIRITYESDIADWDVDKIATEAHANSNPRDLIALIIGRKHPYFESFLNPDLRGNDPEVPDSSMVDGQDDPQDVEQEPEGVAGDDGKDVPDYVSSPVKRPKLGLMATDAESTIIGKRNPDMILRYLVAEVDGDNHPHFEKAEQEYLLRLGRRRAYQLEHDIPTTDRIPK